MPCELFIHQRGQGEYEGEYVMNDDGKGMCGGTPRDNGYPDSVYDDIGLEEEVVAFEEMKVVLP